MNLQQDLGLASLSPTLTALCFPHTVLSLTLLLFEHMNSGQATPLFLVFFCKLELWAGQLHRR